MIEEPLQGILVRSIQSEFGEKIYFVHKGRRYWVRDREWFCRNGYSLVSDVIDVEPRVLYSFLNGGIAPIYNRSDVNKLELSSGDMREIVAAVLSGDGLEFGPGASPFPVPLACKVRYADAFSYEKLKAVMYPGQAGYDLIEPDYVTDMEGFEGVHEQSLDFVVGCHVIEHTSNPIAAIESCHRALKPGGLLVLVVPDKTKTFDSRRELTELSHLVADYDSPSPERDKQHYLEFYNKAFSVPEGVDPAEFALRKQAEGGDIHFHTWTYESFGELVEWCANRFGWMVEFSNPTLPGAENIEFYFVLRK